MSKWTLLIIGPKCPCPCAHCTYEPPTITEEFISREELVEHCKTFTTQRDTVVMAFSSEPHKDTFFPEVGTRLPY